MTVVPIQPSETKFNRWVLEHNDAIGDVLGMVDDFTSMLAAADGYVFTTDKAKLHRLIVRYIYRN